MSPDHRKFPAAPRLAVGVLVYKEDRALLVKRAREPAKGLWSVPGGVVLLGEKMEDAVHRELMEECNIRVETPRFLTAVDRIVRNEKNEIVFHYVIVDFMAEYLSGKVSAGSDAEKAEWVPFDKIRDCRTTEGLYKLVRYAEYIRNLPTPVL